LEGIIAKKAKKKVTAELSEMLNFDGLLLEKFETIFLDKVLFRPNESKDYLYKLLKDIGNPYRYLKKVNKTLKIKLS